VCAVTASLSRARGVGVAADEQRLGAQALARDRRAPAGRRAGLSPRRQARPTAAPPPGAISAALNATPSGAERQLDGTRRRRIAADRRRSGTRCRWPPAPASTTIAATGSCGQACSVPVLRLRACVNG
jgi:hypothetical protein